MTFPFIEKRLEDGSRIRTFSDDVGAEELVWHRDAEDRSIRVLQSSDWYFQVDDQLPVKMKNDDVFFIPKKTWHRVIRKGDSPLVVEIVTAEDQL